MDVLYQEEEGKGGSDVKPEREALTPGELLVSVGGMLAPAAVVDVCALYGRSNPTLVATLLGGLGAMGGGSIGVKLLEGLEAAGISAARALGEVHAKARPLTGVAAATAAADLFCFRLRCVRVV